MPFAPGRGSLPPFNHVVIKEQPSGSLGAQVLDISFTGGSSRLVTCPGAYIGDGIALPVWNDLLGGTGGGSSSSLVYSDGTAATGVSLSFTADNASVTLAHNTPDLLNSSIYSSSSTKAVTLTGLVPSGAYTLYLYGEDGFQIRGTTFSITQGTGSPAGSSTASTACSWSDPGTGTISVYSLNVNYVVFNVIADGSGTLVISYTANPVTDVNAGNVYSGTNTIGSLNGFQLIPAVALVIALSTGSRAFGIGQLALIGTLPVFTQAVSISAGKVSPSGKIPLLAATKARSSSSTALTRTLALITAARSAVGIAGNSITGRLSLTSAGKSVSAGRVAGSFLSVLGTLGAASARGLPTPSVKIALRAVGKSAGLAAAQFSGAIAMKAFGAALAQGRVAVGARAALQAVTGGISTARASMVGSIALKAATAARSVARAGISILTAGVVALVSLSRAGASGMAASIGKIGLLGSGHAGDAGRAGIGVAVGLRTKAATVASWRASATFVSGLASFSRGMAEGIGVPSGLVQLISRGPVSSKGYAAGSFIAGMTSRSSTSSTSKAQPAGILTITTTSAVASSGSVRPTLFIPLTSLSSFGRSVANGFGLLFIGHALFVDPRYVVQYSVPTRMAQYPEPIRMVQYPSPNRVAEYP